MEKEEYKQLSKDFHNFAITYNDTQRLTEEIKRRMKNKYYDLKILELLTQTKNK